MRSIEEQLQYESDWEDVAIDNYLSVSDWDCKLQVLTRELEKEMGNRETSFPDEVVELRPLLGTRLHEAVQGVHLYGSKLPNDIWMLWNKMLFCANKGNGGKVSHECYVQYYEHCETMRVWAEKTFDQGYRKWRRQRKDAYDKVNCSSRNADTNNAANGSPKQESKQGEDANKAKPATATAEYATEPSSKPECDNAGSGRTEPAKPTGSKVKPVTVNQRMLGVIEKNLDATGWNSPKWANELRCARSTIVETSTWKNLENVRFDAKASRMKDRQQKSKGGDQWRT